MANRSAKEPEPDFAVLSSRLFFSVQRELFQTMSTRGLPGLRPRHGAVMAFLDAEGTRASALSERSGQHKQVIGTLIDELQELGYVERHPDPADRRAKLIVPTKLGLKEMMVSREILREIERSYIELVGERRYAAYKRVLAEVTDWQLRQRGEGLPVQRYTYST